MDKIKTKNGELKKYKGKNYNQLMIIDNTEKNHQLIKELNKEMSKFGSRWRISKKARMPKDNKKWGWGGTLSFEDARGIGVYLYHTPKYSKMHWEQVIKRNQARANADQEAYMNLLEKNSELLSEIETLKSQLDEYHRIEEIQFLYRMVSNLADTPEELDSYSEDVINRIVRRLKK